MLEPQCAVVGCAHPAVTLRPRRPEVALRAATAVNWFSAWLVSQLFLSLVNAIGESATFWLFALMCVVCLVWIVKKVPETKGRTLGEIEAMWVRGGDATGPEGQTGAWERVESGSS